MPPSVEPPEDELLDDEVVPEDEPLVVDDEVLPEEELRLVDEALPEDELLVVDEALPEDELLVVDEELALNEALLFVDDEPVEDVPLVLEGVLLFVADGLVVDVLPVDGEPPLLDDKFELALPPSPPLPPPSTSPFPPHAAVNDAAMPTRAAIDKLWYMLRVFKVYSLISESKSACRLQGTTTGVKPRSGGAEAPCRHSIRYWGFAGVFI